MVPSLFSSVIQYTDKIQILRSNYVKQYTENKSLSTKNITHTEDIFHTLSTTQEGYSLIIINDEDQFRHLRYF